MELLKQFLIQASKESADRHQKLNRAMGDFKKCILLYQEGCLTSFLKPAGLDVEQDSVKDRGWCHTCRYSGERLASA